MDNQKQAEEALIRAVEDFVHALRSGLLYREPQQESTEGREMMLFLQLNPQATISQIQNRLAELQLQKQDSICCGYPEITAAFYDAIPAAGGWRICSKCGVVWTRTFTADGSGMGWGASAYVPRKTV